jgi:ATP-dependent Clp protease ATP-binding subunit ClpA
VILIMTTNAGASELAKAAIGFNRAKREGDDEEAINRLFTPEFRNRLDAIIAFAALSPEVISKVVEKFVFQLEAQLGDRNITIELTTEANTWLAERGYDDKFGARPLARVIQEHIKKPLAEEILFGALKDGGIVRVLVEEKADEKALAFEYLKPDTPIKPRDPEDTDPAGAGPDGGGPKPRVKRATRRPRGARQRNVGASLVPKVPLGSK